MFGLSSRLVISTMYGRTRPVISIVMRCPFFGLLRVELDDELLLRVERYRVARGKHREPAGGLAAVDREPGHGRSSRSALEGQLHRHHFPAVRSDPHFLPGSHAVGRNVHALPVDFHVPVPHQLPRRLAARGKAHPVDYVVESGLEGDEQIGAFDALLRAGPLEGGAELALGEAVDPLHLLLFPELARVFRHLAPAPAAGGLAMLARRITAALDRAL